MVNPNDNNSIGAIAGFNEGYLGVFRTLNNSGTDLVRNFSSTSNLVPPREGVWMFQVNSLEVNSE